MKRMEQYLAFIRETGKLKDVERTAYTEMGKRESTAEHSYRLALFAAAIAEEYPMLDAKKLLVMSLLHDMGEIYGGDVSAALLPDKEEKQKEELAAVRTVFSLLPEKTADEFMKIWEEYEQGDSGESKLIKALDKAETILTHNQGENPEDFDYLFNLSYGWNFFETDPFLQEMRVLLDKETRRKMI